MDSKRWNEIQILFEQATQLTGQNRTEFLDQLRKRDEPIFREVESLLKEDEQAHPFLDERQLPNLIKPFLKEDMIGRQIGAFKITKLIASGGMGTVYKACRNDGNFDQIVALKFIHQFLKSASVSERFRREQQILAKLNHPNIARLLDGGITEDGVPYLVMEFVDGFNLSEYVQRNQLDTEQRLNLFLDICAAVSYAQRQLVIHRDLKPGNIFVTGDGQVKLLDFGVAKVLNPTGNYNQSAVTIEGQVPFTPEYAAPEQLNGAEISTSGDVYALGVILYELLSGTRPYRFEAKNLLEIQSIVQHQIPLKPSQAILQLNPQERTQSRRLHGDLDNICLKALKKEPALRYNDSAELAYDINNHLKGIPVSAANDNLSYRIGKFIKRHQPAVAVAVILFIVLLSTIAGYTWQLKIENERVRIEAQKAGQIASFLQSLFEAANPDISHGAEITAIELLDKGVKRVESELYNEPEIQSQMFLTMGEVYRRLAKFETAENLLTKALERRQTVFGRRHLALTEIQITLARLNTDRGRYDLAKKYAQEVADILAGRTDVNKIRSETYEALASAYYEERSYAEADSLYQLANDYYLLDFEEDAYSAAITASRASIARRQGKYEQAEILYKKSLRLRRSLLGDDHADVAHTLNHLGRLYYHQKRFAEAEPLVREALALRLKIFGEMHPETGASLGTLAGILRESRSFSEAEAHYRQVLEIVTALYSIEHPYHVGVNQNIAATLVEQKKWKEAEFYYRKALDASKISLPEDDVRRAVAPLRLGLVLMELNRTVEALPLFEEAYRLNVNNLAPGDENIIESALALAESYLKLTQPEQAENYLLLVEKKINKKSAKESILQRLSQAITSFQKLTGSSFNPKY